MCGRWRFSGLLVVLAALVPILIAAGPDSVDTYQNARLLQKWKGEPEHYARLQRDLHAFHAMAPERQERLRQFDRDLHALDARTRTRLWAVLKRYEAWFNDPQLREEDRMRIEMAGDADEKLRIIRRMRDLQWIDQAPRQVRDERHAALKKLPEAEHDAQIARWRQEDQQRRKSLQEQIKNGTRSK